MGAGLSVYFISYQEGIPFLVKGIPWGISAAILFFNIFFIHIFILKKMNIDQAIKKNKKFSIPTLLLRGLIAGIIISMLTEIASITRSRWAGILSSFPST